MFKKMICLVCLISMLGLVGEVQAAVVRWTDAGPDQFWSTEGNWDSGKVPTSADTVYIGMLPGPTIVNESAVASEGQVAPGASTGALTVDGGTFTVAKWFAVAGWDEGSDGTLNMISGTITVDDQLKIAPNGSGTLNMNGGSITVGSLSVAHEDTATAHVNLDGGIIAAGSIILRGKAGAAGTMDVRGGTLIINGDNVSLVQGFIDNGWITAYDGNGTFQLDYDATNEGKTTLKAVHNLNPKPSDGGTIEAGEVELSWTLPDPCVPGEPVSVDVYFSDDYDALWNFTNPEAIQVVNNQNVSSVVVQTQEKVKYYWAVDTYIGDPNDPIIGPIFSFTADNIPPSVDAGADIVTWLEDGLVTGNLDATVTDSGAYTVQWTVVSEPNDPNNPEAVIANPSAEDASITLSALGEYVLQLEASDGEKTGSDTVTIAVYATPCEATQSMPDYVPLVGDVNNDCKVDEADVVLVNENLGKDISLTEQWNKLD